MFLNEYLLHGPTGMDSTASKLSFCEPSMSRRAMSFVGLPGFLFVVPLFGGPCQEAVYSQVLDKRPGCQPSPTGIARHPHLQGNSMRSREIRPKTSKLA